MKRIIKKIAMSLIVVMLFSSFATAEIASANSNVANQSTKVVRLAKPSSVKASAVDGGIKITFKTVKNAKSYLIYRATSKNGKYTKIGSTTQKAFTDNSVKSNNTYYYTVKAYNMKYKTSYYSSIVSAKLKTIEPIEYAWLDSEWEETPIGLGEVRGILVSSDDNYDITAFYDDEWVEIEWDGDVLYISCVKTDSTRQLTTVDIKYKNLSDSYMIYVPVFIEARSMNVKSDYKEFLGVPEFGSELGISPDFVDTISGFRAYMYNFSTIEAVGEKPLVYMYSYIEELKTRGFYLIEKTPMETGTYHLYTNGKRQVSVQNVEQGELKGIIIGVN